ncbi:MAG: hypothetical protein ACRDSF_03175 [Pseudonocardiaceae bacterium]
MITKRRLVEMVDVRTLVAHFLSDAAAVAGRRGGGHYYALCGVEVIPASLTATPEHGYCGPCSAAVIPDQRTR